MVAIIKYNAGNVLSVTNALKRLDTDFIITDDESRILSSDHVIFPGVGSAKSAIEHLKAKGLDKVLLKVKAPFLGICLGQQLMCSHSEEGEVNLLSLFDIGVRKFISSTDCKVPHIGWNTISFSDDPLFYNLKDGASCYFVHSYYVPISPYTVSTTEYAGLSFSSALRKDNYYGVQFHPEKSGMVGHKILKNFLELK